MDEYADGNSLEVDCGLKSWNKSVLIFFTESFTSVSQIMQNHYKHHESLSVGFEWESNSTRIFWGKDDTRFCGIVKHSVFFFIMRKPYVKHRSQTYTLQLLYYALKCVIRIFWDVFCK